MLELKKRMKIYFKLFKNFVYLVRSFIIRNAKLKSFFSFTKLNSLRGVLLNDVDFQDKYLKNYNFLKWLKIFLRAFS